jgi:ABC-type branched-subunit amino acid transport system substrate-binding protein
MKRIVIVLSLSLLFFSADAQDIRNNYSRAKEQFRIGNFNQASQLFASVAELTSGNPYLNYAIFYQGLSQFKAGNISAARELFVQLETRSPGWERREDLYYWLAKSEFELGKYPQGFNALEKIRSASAKEDANEMEASYVSRIESIEQLESLYRSYPDNARLGLELTQRLIVNTDRTSEARVKVLREKFNFKVEELIETPVATEMKNSYNAAVVLPFSLHLLKTGGTYRNSQYMDFYAGLKLANRQLKTQGININLFNYDIESRDISSPTSILNRPEVKGMDFMIYHQLGGTQENVAKYASENLMPLVLPFGGGVSDIEENSWALMLRPGNETLSKKVIEYANATLNNKNAVIIYSTSKRDEEIANAYKKVAEELGFTIVMMEQVSNPDGSTTFRRLSQTRQVPSSNRNDPNATRTVPAMSKEEIGHVFLATENPAVIVSAMSLLTIRGDKVPTFGFDTWLDISNISETQLEQLGVYLVGYNGVQFGRPTLEKFRNEYVRAYGIMPTNYSSFGYDAMLLIGKAIKEYGTQFHIGLKSEGLILEDVMSGYQFTQQIDNKYVPIFKLTNGVLQAVNE